MKKLSQISESIWSDIQDRSNGEQTRREDIGKIITIDGIKYTLLTDFWELGNEYEEENSDEWRCFAFNKPDSGTIISGNSEDVGVFGCDKWDIGEDQYDVYVLREYIDIDRDDYIDLLCNNGNFDQMYNTELEIQDILLKYTKKIFEENHMSEYAYYMIYEIIGTDYDTESVIHLYSSNELPYDVDFEHGEVDEVHQIDYPMLDNWYEDLKKELIDTYTKLGWKQLESYELDPYDSPGNTEGLAFVKFKN